MKISDMFGVSRSARVDRKAAASGDKAGAASKAAPSESATSITISGIPEAELTPKVREALFGLMNEVQALRAELAKAQQHAADMEKLADRDPLLDLFNRRAFVRELNRALSMIERYDMRASLVFLDLNGLKIINDSKGHSAGDAALEHVAKVLSAYSRQTDIVGRIGGDEFALLLTQADKTIAADKAEDLAARVAATPVQWNGEEFTVSVSIGVAELVKGVSADQTMEQADSAMYDAKRAGTIKR